MNRVKTTSTIIRSLYTSHYNYISIPEYLLQYQTDNTTQDMQPKK